MEDPVAQAGEMARQVGEGLQNDLTILSAPKHSEKATCMFKCFSDRILCLHHRPSAEGGTERIRELQLLGQTVGNIKNTQLSLQRG